jgi:hypothetical protein
MALVYSALRPKQSFTCRKRRYRLSPGHRVPTENCSEPRPLARRCLSDEYIFTIPQHCSLKDAFLQKLGSTMSTGSALRLLASPVSMMAMVRHDPGIFWPIAPVSAGLEARDHYHEYHPYKPTTHPFLRPESRAISFHKSS